jgi:hypothetical protein
MSKKRAVVFAHYDPENRIDDYVLYYLKELNKICSELVFVSTSALSETELMKLDSSCSQKIVRENAGYDFMSWKVGLEHIGNLKQFDEVLWVNDSVYGPLYDLGQIVNKMESRDLDFWGMTDSYEYYHHIQSYFLSFSRRIIQSKVFSEFVNDIKVLEEKLDYVKAYELPLFKRLAENNFRCDVFCRYSDILKSVKDLPDTRIIKDINPTLFYSKILVEKFKYPFIKKSFLLGKHPRFGLLNYYEVIKNISSYDTELISENINRFNNIPGNAASGFDKGQMPADKASEMNAFWKRYNIISSKPPEIKADSAWLEFIPFAYFLMDILQPRLFVELGVHSGGSFLAFCDAAAALVLKTKCIGVDTWESDPHSKYFNTDIYGNLLAGINSKYAAYAELIKDNFDNAVSRFSDHSIDLLHIDGYHSYDSVKNDFTAWLPKISERGVIIFHDILVKERGFGVYRFWDEVKRDYPSFELDFSHGLGVLLVGERINKDFLDFTGRYKANPLYRQLFYKLGRRITLLTAPEKNLYKMRLGKYRDGLLELINDLPFIDKVMAEVGSYAGESTELFRDSGKFKRIICIDPYKANYEDDQQVLMTLELARKSLLAKFNESMELLEVPFHESNEYIPDNSLDFCYIDGNHTYEFVKADILLAIKKIKAGGYLAGHDYYPNAFGVKAAVDELIGMKFSKDLTFYKDSSWMIPVSSDLKDYLVESGKQINQTSGAGIKKMKLLVCIASYGNANRDHLIRIIDTYMNFKKYDVHIHVDSTSPIEKKNVSNDVCRLDIEKGLVYEHRAYMHKRIDEFDLFVFTEDDMLITEDNIDCFLESQKNLSPAKVIGFIRYEKIENDPESYLIDISIPTVPFIGRDINYFVPANVHQGCYALTKEQLKLCINSGKYLISPHSARTPYVNYGILECGSSDIYLNCGLTKNIPNDFTRLLIHHLTDKYVRQNNIFLKITASQLNCLLNSLDSSATISAAAAKNDLHSANGKRMKWYTAISSRSAMEYFEMLDVSIYSCLKNTDFIPNILCDAECEEVEKWKRKGVNVIYFKGEVFSAFVAQFKDDKRLLGVAGAYLRSNIPLVEKEDKFVLYTDSDVLFNKVASADLKMIKPKYMACAPEFNRNDWSYFNTGAMIINVENMRNEYRRFADFVIPNFNKLCAMAHDQGAYNLLYKNAWEKLPVELNWKPYWGYNENAGIIHFHGPKPKDIRNYFNGCMDDIKFDVTDNGKELYEKMINVNVDGSRKYMETFYSYLSAAPVKTKTFHTYVSVHDQDIILEFEKTGKFRKIFGSDYTYLFLGAGDVSKIQALPNVSVLRNFAANIEQYKKMVSFTGWYGLVQNMDLKYDYYLMLEYDVVLHPKFKENIISVLDKHAEAGVTSFIRLSSKVPLFYPYLDPLLHHIRKEKEFYNIVGDLDEWFWCSTSNSMWSKGQLVSFVNWFWGLAAADEEFLKRDDIGHIVERAITAYCILNKVKYQFNPNMLNHYFLDSHCTQACNNGGVQKDYRQYIKFLADN